MFLHLYSYSKDVFIYSLNIADLPTQRVDGEELKKVQRENSYVSKGLKQKAKPY